MENSEFGGYRSKVVLAPMVRFGYLYHRLMALDYGCDLCYTEEIIDRKLAKSTIVTDASGIVRFQVPSGNIGVPDAVDALSLWPSREGKSVVVQLGSADPEFATEAARKVEPYVGAIDVNMGCPKRFSTQMGSGSVLLSKPDVAESILKALVSSVNVPVTCKVRLLENATLEESIGFYQRMERTGISAIAVHCRVPSQKPSQPGNWSVFREIKRNLSIPVIANGDIYTWEDVEKVVTESGVDSVMFARGALQNLSVFKPNLYRRKIGGGLGNVSEWMPQMPSEFLPDHPLDVARCLIRENIRWKGGLANIKYVLGKAMESQHKVWQLMQSFPVRTLDELAQIWSPENYHHWTGNPPILSSSSASSTLTSSDASHGIDVPKKEDGLVLKEQVAENDLRAPSPKRSKHVS